MTTYEPIPAEQERIVHEIVDSAYAVHTALGPGLLESIYETCLCHELKKRGLAYRRQVVVPVIYDGLTFDEGLRLDILVEEQVICEIKAANTLLPIFQAQVLTYLKLTGRRLGLLLNFNVPRIKDGIKRIVL